MRTEESPGTEAPAVEVDRALEAALVVVNRTETRLVPEGAVAVGAEEAAAAVEVVARVDPGGGGVLVQGPDRLVAMALAVVAVALEMEEARRHQRLSQAIRRSQHFCVWKLRVV